jgi:hypothetical protein
MSDVHTVLPAPKMLDLIGVSDTENAIILAGRISSRVVRCSVYVRLSLRPLSKLNRRADI